MSRTQDQQFFDLFSMVLAALVLFTLAMIALAVTISKNTIGESRKTDPQRLALLEERVRPLGQVSIAGESGGSDALLAAARPKPPPAPGSAEAANIEPRSGDEVFNLACTACHTAGVAGAPKVGVASAWTARVAQGMDVLYDHAINGFRGKVGMMPAKGGITSLSDDEVKAAVDYMLEKSE
ncbi:MAG: c-type cytochrome [Pseudomonadota bacterium]